MNFDYDVPYHYRHGRRTLVHRLLPEEAPEWRSNTPFRAKLRIDWIEPGATIKRVMVLRDVEDNSAYPMFVDDIVSLLHSSIVDHGVVDGMWRVKRTGRTNIAYSLIKVED
jgi:hypothetical protein